MNNNFESRLENFVITALMVVGVVVLMVIFRYYIGVPTPVTCFRGNVSVDCSEVVKPWQPGYAPPIHVEGLNDTVRMIMGVGE